LNVPSLRLRHRYLCLLFVIGITSLLLLVDGASAAPPTGYEVAPELERFYRESGGIPVFGFAVSPRVLEGGRPVQYFERQRLELHPDNAAPYDILLGRLGVEEARSRGLSDHHAFAPLDVSEAGEKCLYFPQTGHQICHGFLDTWKRNGLDFGDAGTSTRESIALFGYPISREFIDPDSGLTTQYFERARFEFHPEHAGTPYAVLLGRLGAPQWSQRAGTAELSPPPVNVVGQRISELAQRHLGAPYAWGATGPNAFDCSGFTYYVINQVLDGGFSRDMFAQARAGVPVVPADLRPGDLVFHQNTYQAGLSHAGIYIGGGRFIHAANASTGVIISDLWDGYWGSRFYTARRLS
jgi:cell wall-associated NlpC family hydrolase